MSHITKIDTKLIYSIEQTYQPVIKFVTFALKERIARLQEKI